LDRDGTHVNTYVPNSFSGILHFRELPLVCIIGSNYDSVSIIQSNQDGSTTDISETDTTMNDFITSLQSSTIHVDGTDYTIIGANASFTPNSPIYERSG
jgi:hypothetical protein